MPEFSVVTIVKGRRKHLANLLDSIQRATLQPVDVQIVCMDGTAHISVPKHMNAVLHNMQSGDALPLAAARNKGIAAALTDNIICIDVDCIVSPTLFATILARLTPRVVIAAYPLYLPSVPANGSFADARASAMPHPARQALPANVAVPHLQFWSILFAIEAKTFRQVGGFDETFVGYGAEDTDFAMSFNKAGITQIFVRDYVLHQYHDKYDPPLNHFDAIVQSAGIYRKKWGTYPMMHWLRGFADRGLISLHDGAELTVIRHPTSAEIRASISHNPY